MASPGKLMDQPILDFRLHQEPFGLASTMSSAESSWDEDSVERF